MVKIRLIYDKPEEFRKVLKLLSPVVKSCKLSKRQSGRYQRAYIDTKNTAE